MDLHGTTIVRWLLGSALVSGTLAIGSTSCGSNSPVGWDDSGAAPDAGADSGKIAGDADASNGPDVSGGADGGLDGAVLYVTNDDGTLYAYQVGTWTKSLSQ